MLFGARLTKPASAPVARAMAALAERLVDTKLLASLKARGADVVAVMDEVERAVALAEACDVAITGMELATLHRLFPGRPVVGVGHGVQSWMGQVGARVESPLTLLQEGMLLDYARNPDAQTYIEQFDFTDTPINEGLVIELYSK